MTRPPSIDKQVDETLLAAFADGAGARALQWLTNRTLNAALPPEATDAQLRHREGQRALIAEIHERIARARTRCSQPAPAATPRRDAAAFNGA